MSLLWLLNLCSCKTVAEIDVDIFANIQECQTIENLITSNADVQIYESSIQDEYLNGLEYQEFYGCKYISNDFSFELFAYEFLSDDIAMTYFANVTGKVNDPNPTFSTNSGIKIYRQIAVDGNKAYTVYCEKRDKNSVVDFLNRCFSVDVT